MGNVLRNFSKACALLSSIALCSLGVSSLLKGFFIQAVQAEREEEARRLAQEALTKKEEEATARRCFPPSGHFVGDL